jgi:aminoglycoside phosphotransferase (APT) family kinase protein
MFKGESRAAFRSILQLDKDTWARARGWTLWKALIIITGISSTNAIEASRAHQTITEILADHPLE